MKIPLINPVNSSKGKIMARAKTKTLFKSTRKKSIKRKRSGKRHRPVLIRTKSGWKRPKKSKLFKRSTRINPVRKRRRKTRRNPKISLKRIFNKNLLMQSVKLGGGIVGGFLGFPIIYNYLPDSVKAQRKYLGAINIILGATVVAFAKKKAVKEIAVAYASTGVYDLIACNIPQLNLASLPVMSNLSLPTAKDQSLEASYGVPQSPVSDVARMGMSYNGVGASYGSSVATVGLSGDNPYDGVEGWE